MTYNNMVNSRGIQSILRKNGVQLFTRRDRPFVAVYSPADASQHSLDDDALEPRVFHLPGYNNDPPAGSRDKRRTAAHASESPTPAPPNPVTCNIGEPEAPPCPPLAPPLAATASIVPYTQPVQSFYQVPGAVPYFQPPGFYNLQPVSYPLGFGTPVTYTPVFVPVPGGSGWLVGPSGATFAKPPGQL